MPAMSTIVSGSVRALLLTTVIAAFSVAGCAAEAGEGEADATGAAESNYSDWRHAKLRSSDGTEISIDFQNRNAGTSGSGGQIGGEIASPVWVNLRNNRMSGYEPIIATFARYCHTPGDPAPWAACGTTDVRLEALPAEKRFTGEAPPLPLLGEGPSGQCSAYEVSFFVGVSGGYRLIDPVNRTHQFVVELAPPHVRARCAN